MVTNEPRSSEPTREPGTAAPKLGSTTTRRVAVDPAELAPLRHWLDQQLAPTIDGEACAMFLVAVTEAVTNAIEAHRRVATDRPIDITVDGPRRLVAVEDHGGGLGAEQVEEATTPSPSALRGRGLLIIQSICPGARFVGTRTGTRVELPLPS